MSFLGVDAAVAFIGVLYLFAMNEFDKECTKKIKVSLILFIVTVVADFLINYLIGFMVGAEPMLFGLFSLSFGRWLIVRLLFAVAVVLGYIETMDHKVGITETIMNQNIIVNIMMVVLTVVAAVIVYIGMKIGYDAIISPMDTDFITGIFESAAALHKMNAMITLASAVGLVINCMPMLTLYLSVKKDVKDENAE